MRLLRLIGQGVRRVLAILLLCLFVPVAMSLLLLPLSVVLVLPDAIVRLLALLGVEQEGVFAVFGTSGPVGVAVGLAVAHLRRQLGRLYARVSIAPIEFIYEKLDRISGG